MRSLDYIAHLGSLPRILETQKSRSQGVPCSRGGLHTLCRNDLRMEEFEPETENQQKDKMTKPTKIKMQNITKTKKTARRQRQEKQKKVGKMLESKECFSFLFGVFMCVFVASVFNVPWI